MIKESSMKIHNMGIKQFLIFGAKDSIKRKTRIVFRIANKRVYSEYEMSKKSMKLSRMFQKTISEGITENKPRVKNRIIWVCWLQGFDKTPPIVNACLNSIKKVSQNSNYTVKCVDEKNVLEYIELPENVLDKYKKGIISSAHFSDIIRTALLCKYGGIWIDATVLFTSEKIPDYIDSTGLFFFQDINWGNLDRPSSILSNWLISSESNNPILLLTLKMLFQYWNNYDYPIHYFFYHMLFSLAAERYPNELKSVPVYSNEPPRILIRELDDRFNEDRWIQITKMSDVHKLKWRVNYDDPNSVLSYIAFTFGNQYQC